MSDTEQAKLFLMDVERLLREHIWPDDVRVVSPEWLRGLRDAMSVAMEERDKMQAAVTQSAREIRRLEKHIVQMQDELTSERERRVVAQEAITLKWEPENARLRARVARLEVALRDAALAFENATKYNHREWHLEHEDVEPPECPDCKVRDAALQKWRAALELPRVPR